MTDTLIARLRDWRGDPDEVMSEAADRIEALTAEIEWITKANIDHVAARVELRAEVERLTEENGIWLRSNNLAKEAVDRLEARLTALEKQEPVAWMVYAKGSRRYSVLTFDVNNVPEIYVGGEALPLFLAAGAAPTKEQT